MKTLTPSTTCSSVLQWPICLVAKYLSIYFPVTNTGHPFPLGFTRACPNMPFSEKNILTQRNHYPSLQLCQSPQIVTLPDDQTQLFSLSSNSFGPNCGGWSFPSISSTQNIICAPCKKSPLQIVRYSLPNGWGFLGTHIYPGQYLFSQSIICIDAWNSSRDIIFFVAIIEFGNHLPGIMALINVVWLWFFSESKSLHDIFDEFIQLERGTTEVFDGFWWPPVLLV